MAGISINIYLEEEGLFGPIADDTGEVTHEGNPRDTLHIPAEGDLLETHDHHTSSRADDEHGTSDTGAVSQQLPEDAIDSHVANCLYGIHTHATCHKGHIVNNRGKYTDDTSDEIVVARKDGIERLS